MALQREYNAGAAAALAFIQKEIPLVVPGWAQGFIPADKEPVAAMAVAKVVIDALDADRAKQKQEQET